MEKGKKKGWNKAFTFKKGKPKKSKKKNGQGDTSRGKEEKI